MAAVAMVKTQPSGFFATNSSISHPSPDSASPDSIQPNGAASNGDSGPRVDGCRGWVVVLGSFLIHIWSIGLTYAFGVFINPLQKEFNVKREPIVWLNGLCSFSLLTSGIGTGYLADRYGRIALY